MDNFQQQPQGRPQVGAFWREQQTIPQQGAGSSLTQPQSHLAPGPPARAVENAPFAGQAQGPFGYQTQFRYPQPFTCWQPHQGQHFNDGWATYSRQTQQDVRPAEFRAYKEPQQFAVPLQPFGQREVDHENGSFEEPPKRGVEGDSLENPICLNDDSVNKQPSVPRPTSATRPAVGEKPKSSPREYAEVTKRMEKGDWEGMSELQDLFKQLQRQWPGKYDCISQRWYINKTNPSLSYCIALNGGGIKRSWELRELMRKERADEEARIARVKARLAAPPPATANAPQKRKRANDAESSSQPAAKQVKVSTKPKATKATAKSSAKTSLTESKGKGARKSKVAGENDTSGRSKTPAATKTAAQPPPAYPEMFGFSDSPAEDREAPAVKEPGDEGGLQADFGNGGPLRRGRASLSACAFENVGSSPISLRSAVESAVPTETGEIGAAQDRATSPKQSGESEVQEDDWTNELFEEEDEAPREQAAAEVPAAAPIENIPVQQENDWVDALFEDVEEAPQQLEDVPAKAPTENVPDEQDNALVGALFEEVDEAPQQLEDMPAKGPIENVPVEQDVVQDNVLVGALFENVNEASQQSEDMPANADDGDWDDDFAADFEAELERQMEESEVSEEE